MWGMRGSLLLIWAHAALPRPEVEQNCFYGCMYRSSAVCLYREVAAISIHLAALHLTCYSGKTHLLHVAQLHLSIVESSVYL